MHKKIITKNSEQINTRKKYIQITNSRFLERKRENKQTKKNKHKKKQMTVKHTYQVKYFFATQLNFSYFFRN